MIAPSFELGLNFIYKRLFQEIWLRIQHSRKMYRLEKNAAVRHSRIKRKEEEKLDLELELVKIQIAKAKKNT